MVNRVLAFLMVVAVAGVALGSLWLLAPGHADASGHSATRSFSSTSVAPGGTVTVTIAARDYGGFGEIVETVPDEFTITNTSPDAIVMGQTLTITGFGADLRTVTYTVTATDTAGNHTFSGTLADEDTQKETIGGDDTVTITAPPAANPSAERSFSKMSVDPGEEITVTIRANNYGRLGRIVETLPSGFTNPDASGQTVTIRLLSAGPRTETYTVTASDTPGSYTFSGVLASQDKSETTVGGSSTVTVNAPPSTPDTDPSATRSFSAASVDPGEEITVTIRADNYGGLGRIVETLPSGFTNPDASGQTLTLRLLSAGPQTETYTVTASDTPGSYTFSGVLASQDKSETTVGGSSTVTVNAPPGPSARRSFSSSSVAPGGTVTVTIRADNYGGLGRIVETLPSGFTNPDASGQTVTLRLLSSGPQTETYTVTASDNPGRYSFSGVLESEDKSKTTVGGSSSVTVRVVAPEPEPQVNRAPAFPGSSTTRPINENSASGANVGAAVRATDADGDRLTYSLTGTDAGSFTINSSTGQIMVGAGTTLDYETKASYMVTVTATDPAGDSDSIAVTITVTDVVELGMVSGDATPEYVENGMGAVATYTADGPVTAGWSVSGADMDDFDISNEGVLSFASAPDFEGPADADTNNTYMVTVKAEAGGETAIMDVTVTVTNVDEDGTVTLSSNTPIVGTEITATLTDLDGGINDTTWQWARSSDGSTGWANIPEATADSYTTVDADANMYLKATAMYTDGHGPGKSAMKTTAAAVVTAGDPLVARYDANGNGSIEKREVIKAINDYLFGTADGTPAPSKAEVIRLINLYLFG